MIIIAYFNGGFLLSLGCAMVTFVPSVIKHIRHIHTIFTLTTIKLEISEGLFSKSTRNIPLRHIQDVAVRENFKERLLGIGDIVVDTPSMESRLILNNVNNPRHYADLILEQLERWI
ncbi:MAG: PH domain-containing protein [Acidobacteriota bacterium]